MLSPADILRLVRSRRYRPMTVDSIADHFGVAEEDFRELCRTVHDLCLAGEIVEVKRGCLAAAEKVGLVVGVLNCNPRGFGFVVPVRERDGDDIYVASEDQGAAMHGDLVVVSQARQRGKRKLGPAGKVVKVLRHARRDLVGTFRCDRSVAYVEPDDPKYFRDIYVAADDAAGARPGDKVHVRVTAWPSRHLNPEGEILEVLGPEDDPLIQAAAVIRNFGLRDRFPEEVAAAAEALPSRVGPTELDGRLDLRDVLTFTIDPEDAKDFDDAVSIRREGDGWELGVHIADVAHYVRDLDPVDEEARARGTSVYLPGRVVPMLPERLSNDLCSLRENRVRLTRSVVMHFDREAGLLDYAIRPSVIRSRHRLTYEQVQSLFDGGGHLGGELTQALTEARRLAGLLRVQRVRRGMLELDIPEVRVTVDEQGHTRDVVVAHQDEAHRLIEHFMLSANEVVAGHLARHRLPYVGRRHDEPSPSQIGELRDNLKVLGYSLGVPGSPKQIRKVIEKARGRDEARAVNICILRSLCRAVYSPERSGHYALATSHYTHFTSPIRRYPDLLVHRILSEQEAGVLRGGRKDVWQDRLGTWLDAASEAEQRAESAERQLTRRRVLEVLLREPGRRLEAIVTDVGDRGALIEITGLAFEGRISFRHLPGDFYRVDRRRGRLVGRRGRQIRIGQKLLVRVAESDSSHGQVFFTPCGSRGS